MSVARANRTQVDKVLLAAPRSFCAGVEMAIKALAWMVRVSDVPVYCYHEIVHNRVVVDRFRQAGVVFVDDLDSVPDGAPLMLSAHGSAPEVVAAARARSPMVVDAVCPLVKKVHHEVRRRAGSGHTIIYAGHADHDEALGTLAVAPEATHLVEHPDDIARIGDVDGPVAFLAQTTLAVGDWRDILTAARIRFGDVWVPGRSDLCFATTNRQAAIESIAADCDTVVVIGSETSSNTQALIQVAAAVGSARVVRVNGADELPRDLHGTVGVTAGASAPEDVVDSVLHRLAPTRGVEAVTVTTEDEYFPPPVELRDLLRTAGTEPPDDDRTVSASEVLRGLPVRPPAALGEHAALVDRAMADVVEAEVDDLWLRGAIAYHLGWADEHLVPLDVAGRGSGKKLRAALAILCYRATTSHVDDLEPVLPFAAAVELLHNWSLVHDDIEDGDHIRRGRPALWTVCGMPQALNVGDCLYGLAFRSLARLPAPTGAVFADVARTAVELTVGQMRDLVYERAPAVDSSRYLEMIGGKTAALMGCCCGGGARLGSGDPALTATFAAFGRALGLGFQIRDDILGIWGLDAETGKPTGTDIRRRKKTLPLVLALERAATNDRVRLLQLYTQDPPFTADEEQEVRRILDGCGARAAAQDHARQHCAAAATALDRAAAAGAHQPSLAALRALAEFVTERTH